MTSYPQSPVTPLYSLSSMETHRDNFLWIDFNSQKVAIELLDYLKVISGLSCYNTRWYSFILIMYLCHVCVECVTGWSDLDSYLGNFQGSLANLLTLLTLYLVRNLCPNYQGMFVSHPSYVITCLKTVFANIFEKNVRHDARVILLLPISEICKSTDYRSINVHRTLCKSFNTNPFY